MSPLTIRVIPWSIALALPTLGLLCGQARAADDNALRVVTVSATKPDNQPAGGTPVDPASLLGQRNAEHDVQRIKGAI